MATLGVTFTGAALSMSGGKKTDDPTTPPINAKSSDEENFVKCVFFSFLYPCTFCSLVLAGLVYSVRIIPE